MCRAGMAKAEPMMVCGRVNLHRTDKKDGFGLSSDDEDATVEAAADVSDIERSQRRGNCCFWVRRKGLKASLDLDNVLPNMDLPKVEAD